MRTPLLLATTLLLGCHHYAGGGGASSDIDSLWALAPDATKGALVANAHAVGYLDHVLDHLHTLAEDPELRVLHDVLEPMDQLLGGPGHHLADIGLGNGGFAGFVTSDGVVVVLPVIKRDKFEAALPHIGVSCKAIQNVFACASTPGLLDRIGKGKLRGHAEVAGARGDLELYVAAGGHESFVTATIDDGALSLHGLIAGIPPEAAAQLNLPRPHLDTNRASGFIAGNVQPLLSLVPDFQSGKASRLASSLRGTLVATVAAATNDLDVHIPLTDAAPLESLVSHCAELSSGSVTAKTVAGACHLSLTTPIAVELELWVEDRELRIATHKGSHPLQRAVTLDPIEKELAADDWTFALWGRGSLLAPGLALPAFPDVAAYNLALRALAQISEAGIGVKVGTDGLHLRGYVRTIWSNPLELATKLSAVSALELTSGRAAATGQKLAYASPGTPFADDFAAGQAGVVAPLGLVAAVAVPALVDYGRKSHLSEASLQLNLIGKRLKTFYAENAAFPVADTPLTPAVSCCEQNLDGKGRCAANPAMWQADPLWQSLDFEIDEPHQFQYSYQSDGSTFTATAVGDPECTKKPVTYTLTGTTTNGNVTVTLTKP